MPMKAFKSVVIGSLIALSVSCSREETPPSSALSRTATIKDIMDSMVDPSGDFLFESIQVIADEKGVRQVAPETDEQWAEVRRRALILMEAPNLLVMEGRKVAQPGEKAEYPEVELQPEQIQKLLDEDPASFIRRAKRLQDAAEAALQAAGSKDKDALFKAVDKIDKACENCHLHYWYPNDKRAQEAAKEEGLVID
jgi:cytochrome c556